MPSSSSQHSGDGQPNAERESALQQAQALSGVEAEAVEFILRCQFADARLIAAEQVHTQAMLEQVLASVRNMDRRVAKLMQSRLDALRMGRLDEQHARQCLERALRLVEDPALLANQVVDLDHAWETVSAPPAALRAEYDAARAALRARLESQAELQHAVIATLGRLSELSSSARGLFVPEARQAFERVEQEMAEHLTHSEAALLPKHLLKEFSEHCAEFRAMLPSLENFHQAAQARIASLEQWEAAPAETLTLETLQKTWSGLPDAGNHPAVAEWQSRFEGLLQRAAGVAPAQATVKPAYQGSLDPVVTLSALEKALQEGALRQAADLDKALHSEELRGLRLSKAQTGQLAKMRSELGRLQAWSKWGGHISREELIRAAEELQGQTLPAAELARKVGGLRDRWKELDGQSGPARKELWERFDGMCTQAYAPAAAHFKKLSDERRTNLNKAQALIAEARKFVAEHAVVGGMQGADATDDSIGAVDWKAVAAFHTQSAQKWQRLGAIDRKDKKRLDAEFADALRLLEAPLAEQRKHEATRRENLIAQAVAIDASDRRGLDTIRSLQEQWQRMAKATPLERKAEQALWKKFRAACDALFAKRKEAAAGADAERKRNLAEKEQLCAALEGAWNEPAAAASKLLRDTREAWHRIGAVPRTAEKGIEVRWQAAADAIQQHMQAARRAATDAESDTLWAKLNLCRTLEQACATGGATDSLPDASRWQALPALPPDLERALKARFDHALAAVPSAVDTPSAGAVLEKNREALRKQILRLEITAGIETPPELARERLQMQVEVLQSTLKNGPDANLRDGLLQLCALPALADAATVARMERLVGKLYRKLHNKPAGKPERK